MRDRLRAVECPKEIIDPIGGWSSTDVGESYGDGFSLSILGKWIGKLSDNISRYCATDIKGFHCVASVYSFKRGE